MILMPTRTGLVGPKALIETLRQLADEWDDYDTERDVPCPGRPKCNTREWHEHVKPARRAGRCAKDLRAVLDGYEAAGLTQGEPGP
jgi:hypothetical protein